MKRTQFYLLIAGIVLVFLGACLYYFRVESILTAFVTSAGFLCFLRCFRYKERPAGIVLTGEQRATYVRSSYFQISVMGTIMMFSGFGAGLLADYLQATSVVMWCFGVAILGMILLVGAGISKKYSMKASS